MQKPKKTNWGLIGVGAVVLAVVAFVMTAPPDTSKVTVKKPVKRTSANKGEDQFTEQDRTAHFTLVSVPVKDVFKPLVARKETGRAGESQAANAVPPEDAGGDANWTYTGTAEVDGVPTALFENKTTLEGLFLKQGEHWKQAVIDRITTESVTVNGPSGPKTLTLVSDESPKIEAAATGNQPVAIANPPTLAGPIAQDPNANAAAVAPADQTGNSGRGRRRRGGGGGGGGG